VTTFAALGDSITLGIGDPVSAGADRAWRGWAWLLADGLIEPELHILAASGARVADIERDQLPRALALRPDIASVVFGINDTLRPGFDPELIESSAARTVGALRASGAQVLTMRLPDAGRMLRLPGALARPLAARTQQINTVLDGIAVRFGTLHFDAAGTPEAYDRQMWAADRLHPNERGHRLIARSFHGLLAGAGHRLGPPPSAEPANPPPSRIQVAAWLATRGTAWVLRRSTDLVPYLVAMAARDLLGSAVPVGPRRRARRSPGLSDPIEIGSWALVARGELMGDVGEQIEQPGMLLRMPVVEQRGDPVLPGGEDTRVR
jgi:lysophospholipase L1-like esterase